MPELPEVETVVRNLNAAGLVGRAIRSARVHWPRIVEGATASEFTRALTGQRITAIGRRAKYIVIRLSGRHDLLVHLRMTGRLSFSPPGGRREKHQHVILRLDDGRELRYSAPRKFGRWYLVEDAETRLGKLGPEPLEAGFSRRVFERRLKAKRAMLKPLLLNQAFLAGLGNIYVDEALWEAKLHPRRLSSTLTLMERGLLYRAIRRVLRRGIASQGTTLGRGTTNFRNVQGETGRNQHGLRVFRRVGQACPRCGAPIARLMVAQRSSHICPKCQR